MEFWKNLTLWAEEGERDYETFITLVAPEEESLRVKASAHAAKVLGLEHSSYEYVLFYLKTRYRARFEARVAEMRENPFLASVSFRPNPPVPIHVIEETERHLQRPIPAAMRAFFEQMDGFKLEWESTLRDSEGEEVQGSAILAGIRTFDRYDGGLRSEAKKLIGPIYEVEVLDGTDVEFSIRLASNGEPDVVYFIDYDAFALNMDFERYMDLTLLMPGFWYWQFLFIHPPSQSMLNSLDVATLLKLFPEARSVLQTQSPKGSWAWRG